MSHSPTPEIGQFLATLDHIPLVSSREPTQTQTKILDLLRHGPKINAQFFLDPSPLYDEAELIMECELSKNPCNLPVRNFVHAAGFLSWEGRQGCKEISGEMLTSQEVIGRYAALATIAPPVSMVSGFVQPNGYTLYSVQDGAHRTAAAIKRGDEFIGISDLWLFRLANDILS